MTDSDRFAILWLCLGLKEFDFGLVIFLLAALKDIPLLFPFAALLFSQAILSGYMAARRFISQPRKEKSGKPMD